MVVIQVEKGNGETIGAILFNPNDFETGTLKIEKCQGDLDIADIDFDDIFDTNDLKIRLQLHNDVQL